MRREYVTKRKAAAKITTIAINGGLNSRGGSEERERISSDTPEYGERDGESNGERDGEGTGEVSRERGGGATNRIVVW